MSYIEINKAVSQWLLTFNLCVSVTWPLTCAFHIPCTHTPEIIDMHRGVCVKASNGDQGMDKQLHPTENVLQFISQNQALLCTQFITNGVELLKVKQMFNLFCAFWWPSTARTKVSAGTWMTKLQSPICICKGSEFARWISWFLFVYAEIHYLLEETHTMVIDLLVGNQAVYSLMHVCMHES